ncbi:MAG: hypothetical protein ABIQ27_00105 [Flavobacterium sp.]
MKLLKIDNRDMYTTADKTIDIIIKILLACSVALIACELYILLKL